MHMRHLLLANIWLFVAVTGCPGTSPPGPDLSGSTALASADAGAPAPAPTVADAGPASGEASPPSAGLDIAVTVKLLDAGAEPRAALQLAPVVGATDTVTVSIQLDEKMTLGGKALPNPSPPRVRLELATTVGAVDADGVASYDVTVTTAEALALDSAEPPAKRLLSQVLAILDGATVSAKVTRDGRATMVPFAPPADAPPQVRSLAQSYLEALQNLAVPLPDEAVGVGARWQVDQQIANGRLRVHQTIVYEIVAIDGPVVKTKVTLTQSMQDLTVAAPALPPGTKVESFAGTGSGVKTLDLRRIMPLDANVKVHSDVKLALHTPDGKPGELAVAMDIDMLAGPAATVDAAVSAKAAEPDAKAAEPDVGTAAPDAGTAAPVAPPN